MAQHTGTADLPLHHGRVPGWLAARMARLGRVVVEALVLEYGRDEVLRRLAHPFWFQALGCAMGMDWHSSGITTSVLGALKRGLAPVADELGLHVCGGRGRHSRATPSELMALGARTGVDGAALARTSRLVAKVDAAAVQDGFQLYLHSFIVTDDGRWAVVQQGMQAQGRYARRYHWLGEGLRSFVDDPHQAIEGAPRGAIRNLADTRASDARADILQWVQRGPDAATDALRSLQARPAPCHLRLPADHAVAAAHIDERRFHATLAAAASVAPTDFEGLLLTPGLGARTLEALALVSELVHGAPSRFSDPARFAMAHGGKDGHPFPVPLKVYDATLRVMRGAVEGARLGQADTLAALKHLDQEARRLEGVVAGQGVEAWMAGERARSWRYGGRTVFGYAEPPGGRAPRRAAGEREAEGPADLTHASPTPPARGRHSARRARAFAQPSLPGL